MKNYTSYKKIEVDKYKSEYSADNLFMLREASNAAYADHLAITQTFTQLVNILMDSKKWNSTIFKEKTHFDDSMYSRIRNNKLENPTFHTVVTISAALGLDLADTIKLLASAGHTFGSSKERWTYSFLFSALYGKPIDKMNEFLGIMSVRALGSRERHVE